MSQAGSPRGVELRHLRAFVSVAEERSFTHAATALHTTQPALSRTIAALERLLGTPLFVRDRRIVRLTPAGVRLLPHARRALSLVGEALDAARGDTQILRVGFTWGSTSEYTAPIVRAFEAERPDVQVDIRRYDDTVAGLADGRTHVGFLPGLPDDPRLATLVLVHEPRVVALPRGHPVARREEVRLSDLVNEAVVINIVSGTTTIELWEPGNRPHKVVEVRNVDEWMEAIASGRGIGLTPASTGRLYSHPEIEYRQVVDATPVPIVLAWMRRGVHPLVAEFVEVAARTDPRRAAERT